MGVVDSIIRMVLAITFIILYSTEVVSGIWGMILLVLAGIFIPTSLAGTCPLYMPFGFSTRRKSLKKEIWRADSK